MAGPLFFLLQMSSSCVVRAAASTQSLVQREPRGCAKLASWGRASQLGSSDVLPWSRAHRPPARDSRESHGEAGRFPCLPFPRARVPSRPSPPPLAPSGRPLGSEAKRRPTAIAEPFRNFPAKRCSARAIGSGIRIQISIAIRGGEREFRSHNDFSLPVRWGSGGKRVEIAKSATHSWLTRPPRVFLSPGKARRGSGNARGLESRDRVLSPPRFSRPDDLLRGCEWIEAENSQP